MSNKTRYLLVPSLSVMVLLICGFQLREPYLLPTALLAMEMAGIFAISIIPLCLGILSFQLLTSKDKQERDKAAGRFIINLITLFLASRLFIHWTHGLPEEPDSVLFMAFLLSLLTGAALRPVLAFLIISLIDGFALGKEK